MEGFRRVSMAPRCGKAAKQRDRRQSRRCRGANTTSNHDCAGIWWPVSRPASRIFWYRPRCFCSGGRPVLARAPQLALAASIMVLGTASGGIRAAADREACAATLPPGRLQLTLKLDEPVDPMGGLVQALPQGASCRGSITARWPTRQPSGAGLNWRTTGKWVPGSAGKPVRRNLDRRAGERGGRHTVTSRSDAVAESWPRLRDSMAAGLRW
jgi:hypothetical protein